MRMNKYLASTLFTGLFLTAAAFSPALGQEQSLQPQGAWALTKVDRSAQGGNSYCTLSRKYDQDIVLSLGRNQTEEYSLAIDFQKQTFEKDKSVKVNLQPGPGQIRAYDMMPTSDKALVIRLGWDTGFFDALNGSQQMKVKIADKSYAFAMPEVAKGQAELQDCMEGLKTAAKAGDPAMSTKDVLAAAASDSKDFSAGKTGEKIAVASATKAEVEAQEKSFLDGFAASIKAQEPKLNDEGAPKRKNFSNKAEDEKPAKEEMKVAKVEAPAKKEPAAPELIKRPPPKPEAAQKIAEAPVVAAQGLAKIAPSADAETNKSDEIATLQKRLSEVNAENAALKQKPSTDPAVVAQAQKQLLALETEKKALQEKVQALEAKTAQSVKPEDAAKIEARAKELEIKNAQLEENLRNAQVRIGETAVNTEAKALKKIADLEVKLEAAKNDNATLAKQLESVKVQKEDARLNLVAGDWDLEQATKRFNEAEREIKRLGQQLEQERMSCNREKAEIEGMLFDPAVTDKKQLEKLAELEKQLDDANAKIKDQQKLVQGAVEQQLAAKMQSVDAEKAALSQQVATLQQSLTQKDQELNTLKTASTAVPQQIAQMQQQLAAKDKELADLKTAAAQPKTDPAKDAEIASLKQALAAKDQQIAAAAAKPAQHTDPAILKQIADMQATIADLKKSNQMLNDQNIVMKTESDRLHLQLADVNNNGGARADQVASMRLEIDALKKQMSLKDTQNLTYQNQLGVVQQENAQLKTRLAAADGTSASSTAEVGELTRQVQTLQRQLEQQQQQQAARAPDRSAAVSQQYANIQPASGKAAASGYDAGSIKSLLQKSGLVVGSVQKSSGMAGAENFSWTDGSNVKGLASVQSSSGNFDSMVNQYIASLKSQCGGGDFASMPSPSNSGGVKRTALYETACVNGGASMSSSIIFFEDQGRFIAISNQIDAADMDIAMDSRDKIASFVRGL